MHQARPLAAGNAPVSTSLLLIGIQELQAYYPPNCYTGSGNGNSNLPVYTANSLSTEVSLIAKSVVFDQGSSTHIVRKMSDLTPKGTMLYTVVEGEKRKHVPIKRMHPRMLCKELCKRTEVTSSIAEEVTV